MDLAQKAPARIIQLPDKQTCERGNVAVAISFAAMAISFAIHIKQAVYTSYELANFLTVCIVGGGLQLAIRPVLARLIVASSDLDRELDKFNWGSALVVGAVQVLLKKMSDLNVCLPIF
eukprot:COSAG05_NODE_2007_length_3714_cov_6.483084_2_plen_119_part_00